MKSIFKKPSPVIFIVIASILITTVCSVLFYKDATNRLEKFGKPGEYDIHDFVAEGETPVKFRIDNSIEAFYVSDVHKKGDEKADWSDIDMYIFSSNVLAKAAFNWFSNEENLAKGSEVHENWACGYDNAIEGITVKKFYYLTGNAIIERMDYISDPGITDGKESSMQSKENQKRHDEIMLYW